MVKKQRFAGAVWMRHLALGLMGFLLLAGCGGEAHDRMMHFFFEIPPEGSQADVPPMDVSQASGGMTTASLTSASDWVLHPPFQKGECFSCHVSDSGMSFRMQDANKCRECHETFYTDTRNPHMPDLAQQCRTCHDPHRSRESALLVLPERELCWECHNETKVMATPTHQANPVERCTACHESHHSTRPHMLKARDEDRPQLAGNGSSPSVVLNSGITLDDFDDLRAAFFQEQATQTGLSVGEVEKADAALSSSVFPFEADSPEEISAGSAIYVSHCARCHGINLDGQGPVEYKKRSKVSLLRENRRRGWDTDPEGKSADYFSTITDGREVSGDPSMPPFVNKITQQQRWQVIAYIRSRQLEADK